MSGWSSRVPHRSLGRHGPPSTTVCCPRGHRKPLFTLAPPSYPLSLWSRARAGCYAGHCVIPGCLLKKLGGKLQNPEACSCHAQISLTSGAVGGTSPTQEGAQVVYAKNWAAEEIIKTLRAPQLLCFVSASVQRQGSYIPKM